VVAETSGVLDEAGGALLCVLTALEDPGEQLGHAQLVLEGRPPGPARGAVQLRP